jgi:hypothetical protein
MQQRAFSRNVSAEPLRRKLLTGGLAVAIGIGFFVWSRYDMTTAVLSFDASAARQAEPGVMTANAEKPAVALAHSILSDEAVRELARQAGVPFASSETDVMEFRSRLDMAQTSVGLLRVNYKDTDKKLSAAVANAVANMLVAWMPTPVRQGASLATPALAQSGRQRRSLDSLSPALSKLESQLTVADRKLAALYAQAIALQKADAAAPPSNTQNKHLRKLDADEIGRLRRERTRLMQAIVAEKRREAAGIWQRPFTLVKLAGDAGASQSESGLLSYWPLAGVLCGLLYLGVVIWRYQPIERAAQLELPVLNESRLSRGPTATVPSVELGLSKKPIERAAQLEPPVLNESTIRSAHLFASRVPSVFAVSFRRGMAAVAILLESRLYRGPTATEPSVELSLSKKLRYCEKTIIEAALTECSGRVSGPLGAAAKLGIPASVLESKIKSLKIDKNRFKSAYPSTTDQLTG